MGRVPFFHESPDGVHGPTLRAWLGTSYLPKVSRGPPDSRPEAEFRHEAPVEVQRMVSPRRRRVMTLRQICHMGEVLLPRVGVKTMAPPPPAHTSLRERDDTPRGPLRFRSTHKIMSHSTERHSSTRFRAFVAHGSLVGRVLRGS